jgi:hypothetical protein
VALFYLRIPGVFENVEGCRKSRWRRAAALPGLVFSAE